MSFSNLQQRQQLYRPYRLYPGKQPHAFHQNLHGASTLPLFKTHSWTRLGGHGPSAKLFMLVAALLSLVLFFIAAAAQSSAQSQKLAANGKSAQVEVRPTFWAAAFTSFAAKASDVAAGDSKVTSGSVFEIAVTAAPVDQLLGVAVKAAPAEQTLPAQMVPSNVSRGLIYALTAADKEQAMYAMGGGKAALQELPAQAAEVELPETDPSSEAAAKAYITALFAKLSDLEAEHSVTCTRTVSRAMRAATLSEPRIQTGLESKLAAARASAIVVAGGEKLVSQDNPTGQPPPGNVFVAARAAAALPEQATKV